MAGVPGLGGGPPCSKVELGIRCAHLRDMDTFSKSDPCAVLFQQEPNGRWFEVRTLEAHYVHMFLLGSLR